jgi:hypothetical protein
MGGPTLSPLEARADDESGQRRHPDVIAIRKCPAEAEDREVRDHREGNLLARASGASRSS